MTLSKQITSQPPFSPHPPHTHLKYKAVLKASLIILIDIEGFLKVGKSIRNLHRDVCGRFCDRIQGCVASVCVSLKSDP